MIIDEKLKAIAAADASLLALIGGRFFPSEAPERPTVPYVVFWLHEDLLQTHNTSISETRAWTLYLNAFGATPIAAKNLAVQLKRTFAGYKESEPGASDTDIQAITIENGIVDLERSALAKEYPVSLTLNVWEQLA